MRKFYQIFSLKLPINLLTITLISFSLLISITLTSCDKTVQTDPLTRSTNQNTINQNSDNPNNESVTMPTTTDRKWTDVLAKWGEPLLQKIHTFSGNNVFHEPPPTFPHTQASLQALHTKMQTFAPIKADTTSQANVPSDSKLLDPATFEQGAEIEIAGNVKLSPNANLWQKNISFVVTQSHTTLDCQGAIMSSTDDKKTAFIIRTLTGASEGVHDVTIKNCLVAGYNHGLLIEQQTPPNQRYEQLEQGKTSLDEQRKLSPHDIRIEHLSVAHSRNSGIFIGDHVQNVRLYGVGVVGSGTVGLYFEFGSGHNEVSHSYFSQNGFRQKFGVGKPNREAIAVDSSTHNRIVQSQFDHNGAGGIFLYRNCFEHANDPSQANHFLRTQGSDSNVIAGNTFIREPVGVWVAARQSRNLKGFECGAYTISETPFTSYHLDEAEKNQLLDNTFEAGKNAIIIEDDNNLVQNNRFTGDLEQPIVVGSKVREQSSEGVVKGNQINNNTFANPSGLQDIAFIGNSATANLYRNNKDSSGKKNDNSDLLK